MEDIQATDRVVEEPDVVQTSSWERPIEHHTLLFDDLKLNLVDASAIS